MYEYSLRLIPLGGSTEVTRNMYVYEFLINNEITDIIIVDCGIGFPKEKELGVDFVIPDITYLKDKIDKIRGILFTHGHEDHISAIRFHYESLGKPLLFASNLTAHLIQEKLQEEKISAKITIIKEQKEYKLGFFRIKFIHVTHSIPDTTHILISSPVGTIYHGSDFKFDLTPCYGKPPDFYSISKAGNEGVLLLLSDSLGSERPGFTLSEKNVGATFEEMIRKTKGKIVMTTFSSNISRIRQCIDVSLKYNRKICFLGRSMIQNVSLAQRIGYLKISENNIIEENKVNKTPPSKVCLIVAGSQGQFDSALYKLASDQNQYIKLGKGDRVIFSSDPIPGNTEEVFDVIDMLYSKDIDVFYPDIQEQIHASGHGNEGDLKLLLRLVNPVYCVPIGGEIRHQRQFQRIALELGWDKDHIFLLKNGETLIIKKDRIIRGEKVSVRNIYVDAYGVGDVGNIMLRDRKTLGSEGIVFVAIPVSPDGELVREPEFISKGFVYRTDEGRLFSEGKVIIRDILMRNKYIFNRSSIERSIIAELERFFIKKTGRKPLISVSLLVL